MYFRETDKQSFCRQRASYIRAAAVIAPPTPSPSHQYTNKPTKLRNTPSLSNKVVASRKSLNLAMEWVNLIDNAIDKIKKDGRDPNASEFLDLKAFVNSSGEHWGALMHNFGNNLVIDDDGEVNFPF